MAVLTLILCTTAIDQFTKLLVMRHIALGENIPVAPGFFDLAHVRNTGAAWGMLGGFNSGLIIISFAALVLLAIFHRRLMGNTPVRELSLALLASGIIGNLLDRLRFRYVVDFLDFHWAGHHFPTFNIADSAICVGVALYAISVAITHHRESKQASDPQTEPPSPAGSAESSR